MNTVPLDNPIWNALNTSHAAMASIAPLARRYASDVSPLSGVAAFSAEAFADLHSLTIAGQRTAMFTIRVIEIPSPWIMERTVWIDQMIQTAEPAAPPVVPIVRLNATDVPDMLALVALTEPGPFLPHTIDMGPYFGVRGEDGRLAAMAGTRLRLDRFVEVSAVCTHPDFRGRGYAHALVDRVAQAIREDGRTPFLHVSQGNPAKSVYRKAGFVDRCPILVTVISHGQP